MKSLDLSASRPLVLELRKTPGPVFFRWLLLALLRQIPRQRWLVEVTRGLEEREGCQGDLPGHPGWTFDFHGMGCFLVGPGEAIDVDFHPDPALTIDPYFFANRVLHLAQPGLPERRVRTALPTADLIVDALKDLRSAGLFRQSSQQHVFRLAPNLEHFIEAVEAEDFSDEGRWAGLLEDHGDDQPMVSWLKAKLNDPAMAHHALGTLGAVLPALEFFSICKGMIEGTPGPAVGRAIEALRAVPNLPTCEAIPRLVRRMDPRTDHPYSLHAAARYLLERGVDREAVVAAVLAFARVEKVTGYHGNPFAGDFATLALEFIPEHSLELCRRGLRSSVPIARQEVVAVLAVLGEPWCWHELLAALEETTDLGLASSLLAALQAAPELIQAHVRVWKKGHPPTPHSGPGFTWEEVSIANADEWLESEKRRHRDLVERLRRSKFTS